MRILHDKSDLQSDKDQKPIALSPGCFLVGITAAMTIIGAHFGLLHTRSALGTALRFTRAQLSFLSFLLATIAL